VRPGRISTLGQWARVIADGSSQASWFGSSIPAVKDIFVFGGIYRAVQRP
jgi:hypothetical protein